MAAIKTLAAAVRSGVGKGAARSVRREGRVPGVIYGAGEAAEPISLDYNETFRHIYAGHFLTTIFELDIEGRKERVIPRDYQLDVVKDTPLHVDFLRLRAGSKLKVAVPVHTINAEGAPGIKRGGTLNLVQHAIELLVPADNIPDSVTVDLSGLDINDSVHISTINLPEGCRPVIRDRDFTVVTIAAPTTLAEEPGAAAAVAGLRQMGLRAAMISGDSRPAAGAVAARLGLDDVAAEVLPEGKAARVQAWQAEGRRVAMVGDGVNDAPALAAADLGIAMGTGTDVAMAAAGVTLMRGDPALVPAALDITRRTYRKLHLQLPR